MRVTSCPGLGKRFAPCQCNDVARMAKWLSRPTLDQMVVGSSYSPDLLQNMRGEYLSALCNSRQKDKKYRGLVTSRERTA